MSNTRGGDDRLRGDLAQLRAALRSLEAPELDEAAVRAQFRTAVEQRTRRALAGRGGWRVHLAAAAVVVLAVGAALTAVLVRVETPAPVPAAASTAPAPGGFGAFQPLLNSPGLSSATSYSVVRVRIPLSAFALVPGTEEDGSIEADLLVGEDGLARAIRFNDADARSVSVADQ